jgi:ferric-chelate reductase
LVLLQLTQRRRSGAILWFAPHLAALARAAARPEAQVDLHISVFVTCLCDPEAVPDIPNSLVTMERPEARAMLEQFIRPASGARAGGSVESAQSVEVGAEKPAAGGAGKEREELALPRVDAGGVSGAVRGGVAVCVAGPESLARSAANAVARVAARDGARVGGIALHSEVYAL